MTSRICRQLQEAVPLWGAVATALVAARLAEYAYVHASHTLSVSLWRHEAVGLLHDLETALFLACGLTAVYVVGAALDLRVAFWGFTGGAVLAGLLQLALARYYATTLQPLGTDLWAYEVGEVFDTLAASQSVDVSFWGVGLVLAAVTVGSALLLRRLRASNTWIYAAGGLVVFALVAAPPSLDDELPAAQYLAPNKTAHFLTEGAGLIAANMTVSVSPEDEAQDPARTDGVAREHPWMYRTEYDDVLGSFFKEHTPGAPPPNIVVIVFEGLGTEFVGDGNPYGGFTPFVDSLAQESLYWPNILSTTGRTFGVMPSLFGSLPYADRGFMSMGDQMPRHQSLIQLLSERGYTSSYYSGFHTRFDNVDRFLNRQGIDRLVDRSTLTRLFGPETNAVEQYWGYPDRVMFDRASTVIDTVGPGPRLEIFHTLQTHNPFTVPDDQDYGQKFTRRLQALAPEGEKRARYRAYQSELTTFLYTDDAIRQFFTSYRSRPEFGNTLFVITGDHRLIPVPQPSQIARYHVPLLIYSPLLKEPETFQSVSTLADVTPTLLGLLSEHYGLSFPERAHWLGTSLDTTQSFRNVHSMPLMRNKNQLVDYLHKDYYLAGDQLYRVSPDMGLSPVSDPDKKEALVGRLARFKQVNQYVTQRDRLYDPDVPLAELPPTTPFRAASTPTPVSTRAQAVDSVLADIEARGLNTTEQFRLAREKAFNGEYEVARSLAHRLLDLNPDYHDVRVLLGRTYAWTRQFDRARTVLRKVMHRDSTYADAYNALADAETWAGRPTAALSVMNAGLRHHPEHPSFLAKKARALIALDRPEDARRVVTLLEQVDPSNDELPSLKARIDP